MAFQSGTWMTSQNADAFHQANHGPPPTGKIDMWVVPALLQGCGGGEECSVVPAPLSAKTDWKHIDDTALPVFTLEWESNETSVTQSLYSMELAPNASNCSCDPKGTCRGLCHSSVVSHFVLADREPGVKSSESLLLGIGRQPGMRDCTVEAVRHTRRPPRRWRLPAVAGDGGGAGDLPYSALSGPIRLGGAAQASGTAGTIGRTEEAARGRFSMFFRFVWTGLCFRCAAR